MRFNGGRCSFGGHVFLCLGGIRVSCVECSVFCLGACGVVRCCRCGVDVFLVLGGQCLA